jgi:hypothetical protein
MRQFTTFGCSRSHAISPRSSVATRERPPSPNWISSTMSAKVKFLGRVAVRREGCQGLLSAAAVIRWAEVERRQPVWSCRLPLWPPDPRTVHGRVRVYANGSCLVANASGLRALEIIPSRKVCRVESKFLDPAPEDSSVLPRPQVWRAVHLVECSASVGPGWHPAGVADILCYISAYRSQQSHRQKASVAGCGRTPP